jgi:TorA maturation chaperone TorD
VSTAQAAVGVDNVALLRLLSLGLATPTPATTEEIAALAGALAGRPGAPTELGALCEAAASTPLDELVAAHERLFDGDVVVPPYEGSYELDPFRQTRQMADVAGFYRAFGAEADGPAVERVDHAGTELEFLAFLALRRIEATEAGREEEATHCAEIEAAFLTDHAGRWLPVFFAGLADRAPGTFHHLLGRVGVQVVDAEIAERSLEVERVPSDRRPLTAVEVDEIECGAAGQADPIALVEPHARRRRRP